MEFRLASVALLRSAIRRNARTSKAQSRSAEPRSARTRFAPLSSGLIEGFDRLHSFHQETTDKPT